MTALIFSGDHVEDQMHGGDHRTTSGNVNSRSHRTARQDTRKRRAPPRQRRDLQARAHGNPEAETILFFIAIIPAVECSAALPITAITMTPTKTSVSPSADRAASTAPIKNSDISATRDVATISTRSDLGTDQPLASLRSSPPSCESLA